MRKATVLVDRSVAGTLTEVEKGRKYRFEYRDGYSGEPVSLTMPVRQQVSDFDRFPPFFEGLLPEGFQLESLLRQLKIDRDDCFSQLLAVGRDMVGAVTVQPEE
ncbi:MAG: toxin HipA [Acidobacteria bacterium]|nr:MAG: toxin HipA [Acidobacteriota bacterium]